MITQTCNLVSCGLRSNQRGTALIVALVLLLVMTILGVTAMNSSILQGFMSTSYQQQTRALAFAENKLKDGELDVEDLVNKGVDVGDRKNYYYNLVATPPQNDFDASAVNAWPLIPNVTPAAPYSHVIEYIGHRLVPGESVVVGGGFADSVIHVFRVSAIEQRPENERGGLRVVQSLYVTLDGPDQ